MSDTKITFICEQCVKEGATPPKIGDTDMDYWGIEQDVEKVTFIADSMVFQLKCGHEYHRTRHAHGIDVKYARKWK